MKLVGIICEYNPLHLGHARQLRLIRERFGEDCAIVCLMSGNFVQRGHPAVFHKALRARAALETGADLVLELPVTYALRSAEGFAAGGVEILGKFCDGLCFGAETADAEALINTARALLSPEFSAALRSHLDTGLSFPAARQRALDEMGLDGSILATPNNILAVEYCKAILTTGTKMEPLVIQRAGSYHDEAPDPENPSATSLRNLIQNGEPIAPYVPTRLFENADVHTLAAGERAILARLRTMTDDEFETLPFGSEGLWRKLMHKSRRCTSLEEILTAVKSKRYTRTRLDRMVMCAFLGIDAGTLNAPVPYIRVLGFTERGREALRLAKQSSVFYNVGEKADAPHWVLEQRCADLYALFAENAPEPAGMEPKQRVVRL